MNIRRNIHKDIRRNGKILEEQYKYGDLQSYGRPLGMVVSFTYLGRVLNSSEKDRMVVVAANVVHTYRHTNTKTVT